MNNKDILLVDDDIDHLNLLSLQLRLEGFDVVEACDPGKALKMMKGSFFKMVITDFQMPEMNGVELAITAKKQNSDTCIVMLTGHHIPDIAEAAVSAGISEIFTKPFDVEMLITVIRSFIPPKPVSS